MSPGLKTSEFKVAALSVAVALVAGGADWVSNRYAFAGGIFAAISFIVSRGLAKYEQRGPQPPASGGP